MKVRFWHGSGVVSELTERPLPHFAWPGGYDIHYYGKRDGQEEDWTLCPECANKWLEEGCDELIGEIYWEGPDEECDDCGATIHSCYGDPEQEDKE